MATEQPSSIRKCKQCGIDISYRHGKTIFCSEKCLKVFYGINKQRTVFNCLNCGIDISDRNANSKYCSESCKSKARVKTSEQQRKWREAAKLRGYINKRTPKQRTPEQRARAAERARIRRSTQEGRKKYLQNAKAFKQRQKQNDLNAWREKRYKEDSARRAKEAERNGKTYSPRGQGNPINHGYDVEKAYDRIIERNARDAFRWWFAKKSDAEVAAWYEATGKPWSNPRLTATEKYRIRYRLDPEYHALHILRCTIKKQRELYGDTGSIIRNALAKRGGGRKVEQLLGYTMSELRIHLERQFTKGMTWKKFLQGEIHIDHIIPKAKFDLSDADDWLACWSLPNLRPLWAKDNRAKSAKVISLL